MLVNANIILLIHGITHNNIHFVTSRFSVKYYIPLHIVFNTTSNGNLIYYNIYAFICT